jgi:hypothetical protein
VQCSHGCRKRHCAPGAPASAVEDFLQRRLACVLDQAAAQVLLQGLVRGSGPLTKDRVRLLRHVLDLNTRHNAILALLAP